MNITIENPDGAATPAILAAVKVVERRHHIILLFGDWAYSSGPGYNIGSKRAVFFRLTDEQADTVYATLRAKGVLNSHIRRSGDGEEDHKRHVYRKERSR